VRNLSRPLKAAIIFTVSGAGWLALFLTYGTQIASGLLPLLRWEITLIAPQYRLIDLRVVRQAGEEIVKADVVTRHPLRIAGRAVAAGIPMECSTLVGHLLQPLILLLSTVTAACLVRRGNLPVALFLTFIAAGLVILIDVPFVLVGALEDVVSSVTSPPQTGHSPWVMWMDFLNGGGRLALALAAALTVAAVTRESGSTKSGLHKATTEATLPQGVRAK
jgi:hypothetical protein